MRQSGFTLITLSIILTVASLVFVATLPGVQNSLKSSAASVTKMNSILNTMRGYMAANGVLPCPADPTQAIGATNYGVAAANPGTGSTTGNCIGGSPAAAYADTNNNIAIGMVPVKTLGLSYADALDGYGRDITYAVDTNATGNSGGAPCWASSSQAGAITVTDGGVIYNTIAVLVSHGADGYGAWLPLSGKNGTATRFNNGSTDTSQAANAQVATGGGLTALTSGNFVSFVKKAATSTFDDNLVYKSNLYALNTLPTSAQVYPTVTPPSNGTYSSGQTLTFTITYASTVTVTGTPQLDLKALGTGSIGTSNKAYATYQSGSGTNTLTFSYTVQSSDSAPTSGIAMNAWVDLNGGNLSGGSTCFAAPDLTGVLIGTSSYYRTVTIDHTKVGTVNNTDQSSFPVLFSGTYTYLKTVANGGVVTNANGYDITFTSDAAGHTLLPFEREIWNSSTGASVFWVNVPTISHTTDTVIYLQYGNPTITTEQSQKTATWNSNYKGVWHLGETSGNPQDSTSYGSAGTITGTITQGVTGIFGDAISINGGSNTNYITVTNPADHHLDFGTGNFSVSTWYNQNTNPAPIYKLIYKGGDASSTPGYDVASLYFSSDLWNASVADGNHQYAPGSITMSNNTWNHLVMTIDTSALKMHCYINGAEASGSPYSVSPLNSTTGTSNLNIGNQAGKNYTIKGQMQEVNIVSGMETADWIKTEYNNQSTPDKATYGTNGFYTIGTQTSR